MDDFQSFIHKNPDFAEIYNSLLIISNESEKIEQSSNLMKEYQKFEFELNELKNDIMSTTKKENPCNKMNNLDNEKVTNINDDRVILEALLQENQNFQVALSSFSSQATSALDYSSSPSPFPPSFSSSPPQMPLTPSSFFPFLPLRPLNEFIKSDRELLSSLKNQFNNKKASFLLENKRNSSFEAFLIYIRKKQIEAILKFVEEELEGKEDWRMFFRRRDSRKNKDEKDMHRTKDGQKEPKQDNGKEEKKKEEEVKNQNEKSQEESDKNKEEKNRDIKEEEDDVDEWLSKVEEEIARRVEMDDGDEGKEEDEWGEMIRRMKERHQQLEEFLEEENMAITNLNEAIKETEEKSNSLTEITEYLSEVFENQPHIEKNSNLMFEVEIFKEIIGGSHLSENDKDLKERIEIGAISKNDFWRILMEEENKYRKWKNKKRDKESFSIKNNNQSVKDLWESFDEIKNSPSKECIVEIEDHIEECEKKRVEVETIMNKKQN